MNCECSRFKVDSSVLSLEYGVGSPDKKHRDFAPWLEMRNASLNWQLAIGSGQFTVGGWQLAVSSFSDSALSQSGFIGELVCAETEEEVNPVKNFLVSIFELSV